MIPWILGSVFILILVLVFTLIPYKWPSKELQEVIEKIPGPKTVPFLGNMLLLNVPSTEYLTLIQQFFDQYGDRIRFWILGTPAVLIRKPKDLQALLSSTKHITKGTVYDFMKPWLGEGLISSSGEKWFLHRKLLTNAFHFNILGHHETIAFKHSETLLKLLEPHAKSGKPFNIYPYITNCAMDIICESAMGVSIDAQLKGSKYAEAVSKLTPLVRHRYATFWLRHPFTFMLSPSGREFNRLLKIVHGFANDVIQKRRLTFEQEKMDNSCSQSNNDDCGKKKKLSFLDLLLEVSDNDPRIGNHEIREEVDTFMFAGHDTTAGAMNFCLFLLGNNPDIQEKVLEEVDYTMQFTETSKKLKELNLLERCIKETLRIYPSVPFFTRILTSPLELDGVKLPPGTNMTVPTYILHHDPEVFPDPERFDPDRFLLNEGRSPYSYFPFSAGPRNCIGQKFAMIEMKLILSIILSQYKVESLEKPQDIKVLPEIILKPDRPLNTIITKRYK